MLRRQSFNFDNYSFIILDYDQDYPASSCDHLYSNGVYFNSTYNILNDNGLSKQNCGFAGNIILFYASMYFQTFMTDCACIYYFLFVQFWIAR